MIGLINRWNVSPYNDDEDDYNDGGEAYYDELYKRKMPEMP